MQASDLIFRCSTSRINRKQSKPAFLEHVLSFGSKIIDFEILSIPLIIYQRTEKQTYIKQLKHYILMEKGILVHNKAELQKSLRELIIQNEGIFSLSLSKYNINDFFLTFSQPLQLQVIGYRNQAGVSHALPLQLQQHSYLYSQLIYSIMKESRHFNQNITPGSFTQKNQGASNKTNISSLKAILNQGRVPLSQYINEKAAKIQSHNQNLSYFDKLKAMFNKGNEAKTVRQKDDKGKSQQMEVEYENKAAKIDQNNKQDNFSIGNTNHLTKINNNKCRLESQVRFKERSRSMHGKSRQKVDQIQRLETVSNNKKMVQESLEKTFDKAYTLAESQQPSTKHFVPALVPRFKTLKKQIINYSKFTPIYTKGKEETGILQLDETLGCGANATVRIGKEKKTQKFYAVKIYEKYKLIQPIKKKRVFREIEILSSICHENIIQINNCYQDKRQIHILFEFIPNAQTLQDFLRGNSNQVDLAHKNHIALKITQAVSYLHAHGISHRDIKNDNVMIGDNGVVKLIDFGFATTVTKGETHCGTPNYMAPQLFCKKVIYNPYKVDIWALGILLYYLYEGCYPFRGYNEKELSRNISNGVFSFKKCGIEMREIINSVLVVDPAQRLTADQLQEELRNVTNL